MTIMRYKSICPALFRVYLLLWILPFCALSETDAGFVYSVHDSAAVIEGYVGDAAALQIPSALGGFPVAAIGEEALAGLAADSVTLPRGLAELGRGALRHAAVREIRFSSGLIRIGEEAFEGCENLVGAALPESLITLSSAAFRGCHSLLYVTLPESVIIEEDPFPDCPRLATLAMVRDHPTLLLSGNRLISRKDFRVLSILPALSLEGKNE